MLAVSQVPKNGGLAVEAEMAISRRALVFILGLMVMALLFACGGADKRQPQGGPEVQLPPGPTGGIAGYVSDSDGSPIMGAHVKVSHPGFGRNWTTQADSDGKYSFSGLPAVDGYAMTVSTPPFWITTLKEITVRADEVTTVNVTRRLTQHPGPLTPGEPAP